MDYIFRLITRVVTTAVKLSMAIDTSKAPPRPPVKPRNAVVQPPTSGTSAAVQAETAPPPKAPEPPPETEASVSAKPYREVIEGAVPISPGDIYVPDEYCPQRNEIRVIELSCKNARALGYSFHKKSKSVRITGYSGIASEIVLPSRIGGLPVNEIGRRAFANSDIESVEIPDSIRKIGAEAFFESGVKRVIFGEGVRDIPERAFYKCGKLRTAALPTTLRSIGSEAFFACAELSYISLPRSLRSIGERCFSESDLRGFAAAFYNNFPYDGTAFGNTPLHRNFKIVLANRNDTRMNVILVGKRVNIIFPSKPVTLYRNSVADICGLDLSQCTYLRIDDAFGPETMRYQLTKLILPQGTKGLPLSNRISAYYPDGKRYEVTELLDKSEDSRTERVTVRYLPKRSVHICGENFKLHMSNAAIGQHALYCIFSVGRLELIGEFKVCGEIFCFELCNYCYPAEVCWTVGNEKRVQYLPSRYLVGNHVYSGLLKAFCDNGSHGLFRHEIIDNIFRGGADEFDIHGNVVGHRRLKQREKILIALDVLRSSPELYDNDTSLYSTYIRNHLFFSEKVCEKVKQEYPEYMEILRKISVRK